MSSYLDAEVDSTKKNLFNDDDVVFKEDKYPPVKVLHRKQGSWMEILTPEEYSTHQPETPAPITLDPPPTDIKTITEIDALDPGELTLKSSQAGRTEDQLKDPKTENQLTVNNRECLETVSDLEKSGESVEHLVTPSDVESELYSQFEGRRDFSTSLSSYTSEEIHHDDEGLIAQKPDVHFDEKTEDNEYERGLIAVCIGKFYCEIRANETKHFRKVYNHLHFCIHIV